MNQYLDIEENFDQYKNQKINLTGCNILYFPKIFDNKTSRKYYKELEKIPEWNKREIIVGGRKCFQNRYSAYFASDLQLNYRYSGIDNQGHLMTPVILEIKKEVEKVIKNALGKEYNFNYCLANFYQDGNQNISLHSDDERDLDKPIIASVSIGSPRFFDLITKNKNNPEKVRITLENGSLILMMDDTQKNSKHSVPIQKEITQGRINLTFRVVKKNFVEK